MEDSPTNSYKIILKRLFPGTEMNALLMMSDAELQLVMLEHAREEQPSLLPSIPSPPSSGSTKHSPEPTVNQELESSLDILEERTSYHERDGEISPDGISSNFDLFAKTASCYPEASPVSTTLNVIDWIQPGFLHYIFNRISEPASPLVDCYPETGTTECLPNPQQSSLQSEERLVEAFFSTFHPYVPILDELAFCQTFALQQRSDHRWLGLLNIVLALGSIAAHPATNRTHCIYYQRSKHYIGFDALGDAHIETIQTLGLMAGHYLHYIGQPNLAISLMGTALRLAVSAGLHREPVPQGHSTRTHSKDSSVGDLRQRVWWSLVCLDTWGMENLNHPSLGRSGPGITIEVPEVDVSNPQTRSK
jgi:hypothetical protein